MSPPSASRRGTSASRRGPQTADAVGLTALTRGLHGDAPNEPPCGSLDLTEDELSLAFEFFDVNGRGTLSQAELKARLAIFYPNLPDKEYKFLISEPNFSKQVRGSPSRDPHSGRTSPRAEAPHSPPAWPHRRCERSSRTRQTGCTTQCGTPLPCTTRTRRGLPIQPRCEPSSRTWDTARSLTTTS